MDENAQAQPQDTLPGSTLAGCKIMQKLGQGGMGAVYLARHEALDKLVCVKLLSPDLAREERNIEFFLREARSAAKLEHPNIVHVYNFGQENGSYFIVMSYVDGKPLSDVVAEKGSLMVEEATNIIIQVLEGLGHAHAHTIIHRDIKPSNILLGTDGQPRIVDFGLARSINEEKQLTIAGEMVGTAYFMSPEQGLAQKVDHRADLYSTGATYFYLLTGKYPFDGKSAIEVIHKHISDPFPNIIVYKPDAPLWISRFLERLMRKKPDERYQTAAEAIEAIHHFMAAEKDGTAISNERNIEIPEISARLARSAPPPPPPPPPPGAPPQAPLISDRVLPPTPAKPAAQPSPGQYQSPLAPMAPPENQKLQMPKLYNSVKAVLHACASFAAMACFLLAGANGKPGADLPSSLASPLLANPVGAGIALAAGLALVIWAIALKPRKFTGLHALFTLAAAFSAYTGGIYVPAAENLDMISRAFLSLRTALQNMASPADALIYALFLYLAATKAAFTDNLIAKLGAVLGYALSVLIAYSYFKGGLDITPEKASLILAGACALAGFGAALTNKHFAVMFNPAVFILIAHVLICMMFNKPQIAALADTMIKQESFRVERINQEAQAKYREQLAALRNVIPEYDLDGNLIVKPPPPPPDKVQPTAPVTLAQQAEAQYYSRLRERLAGNIINTAGLVLIALFMCLMANVYFLQETFFPDDADADR